MLHTEIRFFIVRITKKIYSLNTRQKSSAGRTRKKTAPGVVIPPEGKQGRGARARAAETGTKGMAQINTQQNIRISGGGINLFNVGSVFMQGDSGFR